MTAQREADLPGGGLHRRLVEASPDAILVTREGVITFANPAAVRLFGAGGAGELLGRRELDLVERGLPAAERILRLDGRAVDVEVSAAAFDVEGEGLSIQVILRDVSERRREEAERERTLAELARSHEELQTLVRITENAVSTLDLDALLETLLERLVESMRADAAAVLLLEGDRLVLRSSKGLGAAPGSLTLAVGEGFAGWIAATGRPQLVFDAQADPHVTAQVRARGIRGMLGVPLKRQGRVLGVLHVDWLEPRAESAAERHLLEVTAERCALAIQNAQLYQAARASEAERRETEERLRLALESAQLGVLEWDLSSGEMVWTGHEASLPGRERRLTWQDVDRLIHPDDAAGFRAAISRAVRDRSALDHEVRVVAPDGDLRWVAARGRVLPATDGRPPRLSAVFANVSDRRRAEDERERLLLSERAARSAADAARRQVEDMLERISDGFVALDGSWRYTYANRKAGQILGRRPADLVGRHIWTEFPEGVNQSFYHAYHRAAADQMALYFVDRFPPWERWFENRVYPSPEGLSIFFRDVTDERRTEQAFQNLVAGTAAETGGEFFPALVKHLAQALDVAHAIVTEVAVEEPLRLRILSMWSEGSWAEPREYDAAGTPCREVLRRGVVFQPRGVCKAFPGDPDLALLRAESYLGVPLFDASGQAMGHLCVLDVKPLASEEPARGVLAAFAARAAAELMRARAEARLARSLSELQALTARLQSVREEEGTRIAREIHDELGGLLTALKMDLWWLRKRAEAVEAEQRPAFVARTQAMSGLIDTTIQTVQRISEELRPGALDQLGLAAAVKGHVEEFGRRTGLPTTLRCGALPDVAPGLATALFRMLQELLTNVARHAQASRVGVELEEDGGSLVLTVCDDGRGIRSEEVTARTSLGLVGLRERAALAGGTAVLQGTPGAGTRAVVRVPLAGSKAGNLS